MAAPETLPLVDSPLTAKFRFSMRTLNNYLLCIGIFIIVALLAAPYSFALMVDLVAGAVLFYWFCSFLNTRAIKMRCPNSDCRKVLMTNTPWVCGFKQCINERVDKFPFLNQCEHCGAEPKAYRCHHCGELIFLTEDQQELNYAVCLNSEIKPPPTDPRALRMEEKEIREHEITMVELANKLEAEKQRAEFGKKKTPAEEIEDSFTKHHARVMGAVEFARRQRAVNTEKYKDDPEMLKWANDSIDDWLRGRT